MRAAKVEQMEVEERMEEHPDKVLMSQDHIKVGCSENYSVE